jgi:hypothetical protein
VISIIALSVQRKEIRLNPAYRYFLWALFAKVVGAISLSLIYVYYYAGGDTFSYHDDGVVLADLLWNDPGLYLKILFTPFRHEYLTDLGYIEYWNNTQAFNTDRFVSVFEFVGMQRYMISSVLMAVVSFTGIWKLYLAFCDCYPKLYKRFALSILFVPSVVFWGSGLLKDSLTIAGAGWYVYSFYNIFIKRRKIPQNIIALAISIMVMIMIKPYVFIGLLPGSILWMVWNHLLKIRNLFLRIFLGPLIAVLGVGIGFLLWSATSSNLGQYSTVDSMVQKAYVSYSDLKMDHYSGNGFDIGDYDPTLSGMMVKFVPAVNAALFRPYIWEAKNPVMIISGLENLIFLSLTIYFLFRRPVSFMVSLFSNPLVLFSIIFGVFFAFSVGISTSNFGALVRLRIPAIPFFLSGIILIEYLVREAERNKRNFQLQNRFN